MTTPSVEALKAPDAEGTQTPLFPSYEDLKNPVTGNPARLSPDARRIVWTLNGPLTTSIRVMDGPDYTLDTKFEPYLRGVSEDGTPIWHPVSQMPLTETKISSVIVHIYELKDWEDTWSDMHRDHHDLDEDEREEFHYGTLIDDTSPEPYEDVLLRCCGEDRPLDKNVALQVRAREEFLTVHDYLSMVHPWLMGLRRDILDASAERDGEEWPDETKLGVMCGLNLVMVDREEDVLLDRRKRPTMPASHDK